MKTKTLKKLSKLIPWVYFVMFVGLQVYLVSANYKLNKRVSVFVKEHNTFKDKTEEQMALVGEFLGEAKEVDEVTLGALAENIRQFEEWQIYIDDFVRVHNDNVAIYNSQIESLQWQIDGIWRYLR